MKTFVVGRTDLKNAKKTVVADQHIVDETGDHVFFADGEEVARFIGGERIYVREVEEEPDRE